MSFLIHFLTNYVFYVNINTFKQCEFKVIIYHFKLSCQNFIKLKQTDIKSILFFNHMFTNAELHY